MNYLLGTMLLVLLVLVLVLAGFHLHLQLRQMLSRRDGATMAAVRCPILHLLLLLGLLALG